MYEKLGLVIDSAEGQDLLAQVLEHGLWLLGWTWNKLGKQEQAQNFKKASHHVAETRRVGV